MSLDDKRRFNAVNDEARSLGYQIVAELNPAARIYTVNAYPLTGDAASLFLCRSRADAVDAVEEGLEILRGVAKGGQ